jgi:hypothetical protein
MQTNTQYTEKQGDGIVAVSPDRKALAPNTTSGCVRVTLPVSANKLDLRTALFRGMHYVNDARKMGGKARSFKSWNSVIIEHTGLTREQSKYLIDYLIRHEYANTLKVIIEERDHPEFDLESPGILHGEFAWGIFDKHFLFSLPHYAIIVSSWTHGDGKPVFVAKLDPGLNKSLIWKRAVDTRVAHRACGIYWSPEDVREIYGFSLETLLEGSAELETQPFRL